MKMHVIRYTTIDGCRAEVGNPEAFGAKVISNTYGRDGGVIEFDAPVIRIGHGAFRFSDNLESIELPDNVHLECDAFVGCKRLQRFKGTGASADGCCWISNGNLVRFAPGAASVYAIPAGVASIGNGAFLNSESLLEVHIPDGVRTIGDFAFAGCSRLASINMPSSLKYIGIDAFEGCSSVKTVYVADLKTWMGFDFWNSCDSNPLHSGSVMFIEGRLLTKIHIPKGVTVVGNMAFCGGLSFVEAVLPLGVKSIEEGAFMWCKSLEKVCLSEDLDSIGRAAFHWCENLEEIIIPDSVESIGEHAFLCCRNLKTVYCRAAVPPMGAKEMFEYNVPGRKIYVPHESLDAYRNALYWSEYVDELCGYDSNT